MNSFSLLKWFRNVSISKKLYFVLGLMAVLILIELGTLFFAVNTLSSVRAFVGGEGLWSKAQKDAIYSLRTYARVENDEYYREYLQYLKVPLGDRKARIEMAKPKPDFEVIRQGFLEGRNHPDDIDGMIKLFRRFNQVSYISKAIRVWGEADSLMMELQLSADTLHYYVGKKNGSFEETEANLDRINELNKKLTVKEDEFSATLGEGSRWLEGLILKILFGIALTVEISGLFLTILVSRDISKGINETMRIVKKVALGDFKERAKVFSKDEIGQLATSFNQMTDDLEKNINERKKVEQKLVETKLAVSKKVEEKFRGLLETAPDAMVIVDATGKIKLINAQTEKMFGYSRNELIDQQVEILIPGRFGISEHKKHRENYFKSPNARPMGQGLDLSGKHKSGIEFPIEISLSPLMTDEGMLVSAAIRDITERKDFEKKLITASIELEKRVDERTKEFMLINKKLEATNRELESFAYITSHDLKAPLRAIGSLSDWLYADYADKLDDNGKEQLQLLKKRVSKMHELIDGILNFSRIGRVDGEKQRVDINLLLKEITDLIQVPAHIKIVATKTLPVLNYYKTHLMQLFENLISNAVKYCDKPEGIIEITCDDLPDMWRFRVKDNGMGIDEKYHTKIFEIFQRLRPNDETEGTGIGLTIVKKIVENAGGTINLESTPGIGTTFEFTLPKN